jgi:hypothetical protein
LKLLVDENLPPRLVENLTDLFPDSVHVRSVGLGGTADSTIWEYAKAHGFTFMTRDKDFANLSMPWGAPPKGDPAPGGELFDVHALQHCAQKRDSVFGIRKRYESQLADPEITFLLQLTKLEALERQAQAGVTSDSRCPVVVRTITAAMISAPPA